MLFWIDKILKLIACAVFILFLFLFADVENWVKVLFGVLGVLLTISGSRDNIKHNIIYKSRRNFIIFTVAFVVSAVSMILGLLFNIGLLAYVGTVVFLIVWYTLTSKDFLTGLFKSSKNNNHPTK